MLLLKLLWTLGYLRGQRVRVFQDTVHFNVNSDKFSKKLHDCHKGIWKVGVAELKRQSSAIAHHLQNINQNVTSLFTKSIREWTRSEHENSLLEQNHQKRIPCIESCLLTIPWYQGCISKELKHEKEWTLVSKFNCFIYVLSNQIKVGPSLKTSLLLTKPEQLVM